MTKEELKEHITNFQPNAVFDETGEWLNVQVEATEWKPFAQWLRNDLLNMDYLFCLTCIDWAQTAAGKTQAPSNSPPAGGGGVLTMVYHFSSTVFRHTIVVKVKLDRNNPEIETVSDLWRTAEFHEREVFDLFGVRFLHHPDLRRLVLADDFEGHPLRKDFDDPVNMIKL
ncbi:NADH-quinone oxidoreductase subunit C [Niastella caeni]|uniref:NADH-quinone oxidoreductase n=1 Tax=Niastella caeni TaxID=2569763 RepID=A0A4S8HZI2_9BACT|nr:NADH-quinone oxidoreductase subunit C [Niastella caeni]THU41157.1 NADH-quinone oxidoreductase subunit C [Niastella caeni]